MSGRTETAAVLGLVVFVALLPLFGWRRISLLGPNVLWGPLLPAGLGLTLGWRCTTSSRTGIAAAALVLSGLLVAPFLPLPFSPESRAALAFQAPIGSTLFAHWPIAPASTAEEPSPLPPVFSPARTSPLRRRWSVVLITIDSLRPDRMHFFGNPRPTTPRMDSLARESVAFTRAYAVGSSTFASVPAFLTSQFMSQLRGSSLHRSHTTLAEILRGAGWHTVGLFAPLPRGTGQGFDVFRHSYNERGEHTDRQIVEDAVRALERAPSSKPIFLWTHLYDPHNPYDPQPDAPRWGESPKDRYDRELWGTDREMGRLLEAVSHHLGSENSIILLSADHGDEFGEHGQVGHGGTLYETLVHVPFVVRVPGARPRRLSTVVSLLDLVPTVLDLTGVPHPARLEGRSLLPWLEGAPPDEDRIVFQEVRSSRVTAAHQGPHHLIWDPARDAALLYRVDRDPLEANAVPLSGEAARVADRLRRAMMGLRARLDGPPRGSPGRSQTR